jgi:hypothetical protein
VDIKTRLDAIDTTLDIGGIALDKRCFEKPKSRRRNAVNRKSEERVELLKVTNTVEVRSSGRALVSWIIRVWR